MLQPSDSWKNVDYIFGGMYSLYSTSHYIPKYNILKLIPISIFLGDISINKNNLI